jgi:formylglycine-generating enzyme required for sulfatase activity
MVLVPGGRFAMGSNDFYPDEGPAHEAVVAAFELDAHPVTNRQFARFVAETGYVTTAERDLDPALYPGIDPDATRAGSLVFTPTAGPVDLGDWRQWWRWMQGADWRHPFGPRSSLHGKDEHPVVQVSFEDASAYAAWAGKRLPTEAEWEHAARFGSEPGWPYAWGTEPRRGDRLMANTWQGRFPYLNTGADGWAGTAPVGSFPASELGFVDLIGNVWEWTSSYYTARHRPKAGRLQLTDVSAGAGVLAEAESSGCGCGCGPESARGQRELEAAASAEPGSTIPRRVLKGGSHLCAPEYCLRYRPAARSPQSEDSATTHIGFRCARDVAGGS